mmetsp:Transcript_9350/g.19311  ORF Transcript_9350/g.19311 Transcript_9350/m.19311 type:complete len:212 (-) Transcript_9350:167-802(-)|eukprot:CAMPEP_0118926248 /NCGR_PEP_ID=MMETSP1169-20130426/3985_1 /TAXON_ID=36882 /ORGANISM="Pyramimonas obovata, Strain CCMP722" /LENGTH=211 /DNA_ID=CAMNT_0006867761 /DNA_START=104 /DNA_END=739 /DNA_ORIENTATION=-
MASHTLGPVQCTQARAFPSSRVFTRHVSTQYRGARQLFDRHKTTSGRRGGVSVTRASDEKLGIVVVDHGSRRKESNELLDKFVDVYKQQTEYEIVEPAHMELAPPSIGEAFKTCVDQGATTVIISPYFLSPGRHWKEDIPRLAREAAVNFPEVKFLVTAPIGVHSLVAEVLQERMEQCMLHAAGKREECELCKGTDSCKMFVGGEVAEETN